MSSIIALRDELIDLISEATESGKDPVPVYKQEELFSTAKKIGTPCVGVVYVATAGDSTSKSGLALDTIFDIYVLGDPECKTMDDQLGNLSLLENIRNAIKCNKGQALQSARLWKFVSEQPVELGNCIGYIQRWKMRHMGT